MLYWFLKMAEMCTRLLCIRTEKSSLKEQMDFTQSIFCSDL